MSKAYACPELKVFYVIGSDIISALSHETSPTKWYEDPEWGELG